MRYLFTLVCLAQNFESLVISSVRRGCGSIGLSKIAGGSMNWHNDFRKHFGIIS